MSIVSAKGMYGLAAMFYLEKCEENDPVQISAIAQEAHIPQNFLEQILAELRKGGFLQSVRGAKGGYVITNNGKEATVLQILRTLEGEMCQLDCKTNNSVLSFFWEDTARKIKSIFDVKLKDIKLLEEQILDSYNYSI
jgi:Rrf2 family protein